MFIPCCSLLIILQFVRVAEYANLDPEEKDVQSSPIGGAHGGDESQIIPEQWPSTGKIEFRDVTIRYDLDGPDILTNVSLTFDAGERVAIIGRTGSGKSTVRSTTADPPLKY